jgi:hypothetical protein
MTLASNAVAHIGHALSSVPRWPVNESPLLHYLIAMWQELQMTIKSIRNWTRGREEWCGNSILYHGRI